MVEAIFYKFVADWVPAVLAFIFGRYAFPGKARAPDGWVLRTSLFLSVWVVVFIASLLLGTVWREFQLPASGLYTPDFWAPVLIGAAICRLLLERLQRRTC